MTVAVLGSDDLEVSESDMFKYIHNVIYPHPLTGVVVVGDEGIAECASDMASLFDLTIERAASAREAIEMVPSVVIFRYHDDLWHNYGEMCARKGRPFKEYVVTRQYR